jgi:hypothetical protein
MCGFGSSRNFASTRCVLLTCSLCVVRLGAANRACGISIVSCSSCPQALCLGVGVDVRSSGSTWCWTCQPADAADGLLYSPLCGSLLGFVQQTAAVGVRRLCVPVGGV